MEGSELQKIETRLWTCGDRVDVFVYHSQLGTLGVCKKQLTSVGFILNV